MTLEEGRDSNPLDLSDELLPLSQGGIHVGIFSSKSCSMLGSVHLLSND